MKFSLQRIKAVCLIAFIVPIVTMAETATTSTSTTTTASQPDNMTNECPSYNQLNGLIFDSNGKPDVDKSDKNKLWECPLLPYNTNKYDKSPYKVELGEVDFIDGQYKCNYSFRDSGQYVQSCKYQSELYKAIKRQVLLDINGKLDKEGNLIVKGMKSKPFADFNLIHTAYPNIDLSPKMITAQLNYNKIRRKLFNIISDTNGEINLKNKALDTDINKIRKLTYDNLVKPYYKPSEADNKHKGYTFSNFLAGLITLDPKIVKDYNPNNGELIFQPDWKTEAMNGNAEELPNIVSEKVIKVWHWIKSVFGFDTDYKKDLKDDKKKDNVDNQDAKNIHEDLYNNGITYNFASYTDIFKQKVWGFYYLLSERFDIGYNTLSTTLLFLFGSWFIILGGGREGIRYVVNKENYHNGITESGWIKTLVILSSIGAFWLSMPSSWTNTQTQDNTGAMEQNEFRKNFTLAKTLIRKTAQSGADTANMFADLGLSAFLEFLIHQERIATLDNIKGNLDMKLNDLYMYSSATALRNECLHYYNTTDKDFLRSSHDLDFRVNTNWHYSTFASTKNLDSISFEVCQKSWKIFASTPYSLGFGVSEAQYSLEHINPKMSEALLLLSANQIAQEEKLGWVSAFGVPLTYFLMKNSEMFLAEDMDYDEIQDMAKKYMSDVQKDGSDMKRTDMIDDMYDNVGYASAELVSFADSLFVYNILPAFSPIQQKMYDFGEKVYGSKLEIFLDKGEVKLNSIKGWVKNKLSGISGKLSNKFSFLNKLSPIKGAVSTILSATLPDITSDFVWHSLIYVGSFFATIFIWEKLFTIIFMVGISMLFLVTFILYFKELIVHFTTSLFFFIWAFTQTNKGQGEGKITEFIRDTIVIVYAKPTMLIFGAYIFIFVYEMMMSIYSFIYSSIMTTMGATVSIMARANGETDVMSAYGLVASMGTIAELFIKLFGFYLAYMMILKMPDHFIKKLGVNSENASNQQQMLENVSTRQEKHLNPYG